jgi:hypothetical protein
MDFLKKAEGMMNKAGSGSSNNNNNQAAQGSAGPAQGQGQTMGNNQNEDYGDKGLFLSLPFAS